MSVEYNLWLQLTEANAISSEVEQNTADITTLQGDVAVIPDLSAQVATNTAGISTNVEAIQELRIWSMDNQAGLAQAQQSITILNGQVSTLQGEVAGLPALTTQVGINTSNITTLQGLVLPVWKSGGEFSNPAILLPASANTLITSQTIVTTTTTAKYLILASFEGTTTAVGTIFMTIGRSTNASPTATNTINLTNRFSALTNSISGNGLSMWGSAFNTSRFSAYASVVDTPAFIGNVQYSVWSLNTSAITNTSSELVNLTILQVLP
jgi:hypothetical protein